jgi:hypothetical protein
MIKRYKPTKDNTITNAFGENLTTRGTGSNMGLSDIIEVFSIYGQVSSSAGGFSSEEARILIEFDLAEIQADINNGVLDSNAKFFLRLFNAEHGKTLPRNYNLEVKSVSGSWQEGLGLDMENYSDLTYGYGSSWINSSGSTAWSSTGGDFYGSPTSTSNLFEIGTEDLEIDVTAHVTEWLGGRDNNGLAVKLPADLSSQTRSFYTKMFFARDSQFFHKRPVLEARWNSQVKDQRVSFFASSSLAPAGDNLNTIYLYNYHRGALANIPAIDEGEIYVDLYDSLGSTALTQCIDTPATGGWVSTGIYTASVCLETTGSELYDVWYSGSVQYHTGTIEVETATALSIPPTSDLVVSCTNDQGAYRNNQTSRFYFYIRDRDWSPNIYVVATSRPKTKVYDNLMFKISKVVTDEVIFDYDTTNLSTTLSYDSNGNYFDLDISMLEPNYVYEIELALFNVMTKSYQVLPFKHRFRVVNNEY